jgi:hypothetical protein
MNSIVWFILAIFIMMITAIVSNSGATSSQNIQNQIFLQNCPMPIYAGIATLTDIDDFSVTYTVEYSATNNTGTYFECSIDSITGQPSANTVIKQYGATLFDTIPYGWLGYVADYISAGFARLQAYVTIIVFAVTPVNFDIMGYTIDDLSGVALVVVIGIYIFCYIGIGQYLIPMILGVVRRIV